MRRMFFLAKVLPSNARRTRKILIRKKLMKAIRERHFEILILKNCFCDESRMSSRISRVPLVKAVVVGMLSQLPARFEDLVREY